MLLCQQELEKKKMTANKELLDKAMAGVSRDGNLHTLTVEYHALNGRVFTQSGVLWYEMTEAFNELSRRAYKYDTSVDYVVVY